MDVLTITVLFQLVCSLREIRFLNAIGPYPLPTELVNFYSRVEQLFSFVQNLNQLIKWYNQIRKKSRPVEFNLFEDEIILIDLLINCGIQFLNWNSSGTNFNLQIIRLMMTSTSVVGL